jgi:hypothetical protein
LPLFGIGGKPQSIRDVQDWERTMKILSENVGEEFEVALSKIPLGMFGKSDFELLRDKQHRMMIYPHSLNEKAHFRFSAFFRHSLDQLDVGFAPDGTGTQLLRTRRNFVKRSFLDAFVRCVREVYGTLPETMHFWVRGNEALGPMPVFLAAEPLSMTLAPYLLNGGQIQPRGKYQAE